MEMQVRERRLYRGAIVLTVVGFLFLRWPDVIAGDTSGVDALAVALLGALALLPLFREVSIGGVTLKEMEVAVQKEITRVQDEAIKLQSLADLRMMPIWEKEHSSVPSAWSAEKVQLLRASVEDLEVRFAQAANNEKPQYAIAVRELYWQWLAAARHHWASSMPYQDVWRHVERGFSALAGVEHRPTR